MYSQKSYSQKLGTCTDTIAQSGCYLVSFCNLLNELGISKMNPLELNEYLIMKGGYTNGCLFNSTKIASLFGMTYAKTMQKPANLCIAEANLCIAETDHYKAKGVPQHFFLFKNDAIIDPLDLKPVWRANPYNIVSYRVYGANLSSSAILHGIDLSHWNKVTDWSKIKTDFIIQKCTQGTGYLDPTYKERKDKIYGSYHFADGGDAIKEADWYLKNCGNEQLVLDWEIEHADPVGWCKKFIGRLKEKGRTCWLYTNDARATKYAWPEDWTYWIARYGVNDGTQSKEPAFKNWSVWQYTSRGKIAGIDGYVDLNIAKQLNKEVMCTKCEELKKKVEKLKLENMELEVDRLNCEEIIPKLTETIENQREVLNTLTEKNAALKQKVEEYEGEQSISTLIGLIIAKIWK